MKQRVVQQQQSGDSGREGRSEIEKRGLVGHLESSSNRVSDSGAVGDQTRNCSREELDKMSQTQILVQSAGEEWHSMRIGPVRLHNNNVRLLA